MDSLPSTDMYDYVYLVDYNSSEFTSTLGTVVPANTVHLIAEQLSTGDRFVLGFATIEDGTEYDEGYKIMFDVNIGTSYYYQETILWSDYIAQIHGQLYLGTPYPSNTYLAGVSSTEFEYYIFQLQKSLYGETSAIVDLTPVMDHITFFAQNINQNIDSVSIKATTILNNYATMIPSLNTIENGVNSINSNVSTLTALNMRLDSDFTALHDHIDTIDSHIYTESADIKSFIQTGNDLFPTSLNGSSGSCYADGTYIVVNMGYLKRFQIIHSFPVNTSPFASTIVYLAVDDSGKYSFFFPKAFEIDIWDDNAVIATS